MLPFVISKNVSL